MLLHRDADHADVERGEPRADVASAGAAHVEGLRYGADPTAPGLWPIDPEEAETHTAACKCCGAPLTEGCECTGTECTVCLECWLHCTCEDCECARRERGGAE